MEIKDKSKRKDKVSKEDIKPLSHISFSFRYLTTNGNFNFSYFGRDIRKSKEAYEKLLERMIELCNQDMSTAKSRGKIQGCEPIPYKQLSQSMQIICNAIEIIAKDSSLSVFRFGQNNYRLLCKTDIIHPNLLHIIAFDFDFSAYNHGT